MDTSILEMVNNELQQIWVRGIDTVHMANALKGISDLINALPSENDDATMEKKEDEENE